jgi:hypothetical protein
VWVADDNGGEGTGTVKTFTIVNPNRKVTPDAPTTEPPDPTIYTEVVDSANDTANLTSYTLDNTVLQEDKAYYSKVKYRDDTTPDAIESEWSPWNKLTTKSDFTTP